MEKEISKLLFPCAGDDHRKNWFLQFLHFDLMKKIKKTSDLQHIMEDFFLIESSHVW